MNPLRDNPFNPRLATGVVRVGFRKWYERELLSSHAHMLLALLALFAGLAALEALGDATPSDKVLNLVMVGACLAITLWALRRYLFLLMRAEHVASQADCARCGDYGRFIVLDEDRPRHLTRVRCRKCEHSWEIAEE